MTNSADSDQLASSEANWSGPTLFVKAGNTRVQQDQGKVPFSFTKAKLDDDWMVKVF